MKCPLSNKPSTSRFLHSISSISSSSASTNLWNLLQGRISVSHLLQIHAQVYRSNSHQDNRIATRLIDHYSSQFALRVFNQLRNPNVFPFNSIIRVLADNGCCSYSFTVFKTLKQSSFSPNDFTFSFLFKVCLRSNDALYVLQIHTQIVKLGYLRYTDVCGGLLSVYAKGSKDYVSARKVFDEMPDSDVVSSWTCLISCCAQSGRQEEALRLFCKMVERNLEPQDDTMVSVLSACSCFDAVHAEKWALSLLELTNKVGVRPLCSDSVNIALICLYGKCGKIENSEERFEEINNANRQRSLLPWNVMITAYVQNNCPLKALNLFRQMVKDHTRRPNHVTMVSVLSACGEVGDIELGRWIHHYVKSEGRKNILETNRFLATALIDMYCKCGNLDSAKEAFDQMESKDVVSFNAMIMGLAANGKGEEAINLFKDMQELGLVPNSGTFLSLLWACSHSGLSHQGRQIFESMSLKFSVSPRLEHYACYIDLLAREGLIEEALEVVASMTCKPNNFVWGALLGGCSIHSRSDLARDVYNRLVALDPDNSGGYVMFANAFAVDHQWGEVSVLRLLMKEKGIKKQPGRSWINVGGAVHEFLANSRLHVESDCLRSTLHRLVNVMKVC